MEKTGLDLERQLKGYRLTTAEILYRLPDHPAFLQTFIWQELDLAPRYPTLRRFLDFWDREIEAKIHTVTVASRGIVTAGELRRCDVELQMQ